MYRLTSLLGLVALVWCASLVLADIPKLINYQGMLTDDEGNPLNQTVTITFKIYNDSLSASAINKKWEETQTGIDVVNGLFNVTLGKFIALDLDFSEDYWLDITVGGEHLPDRVRLTSVGYAYRAQKADTAAVALSASTGGGWVDAGNTVRLQTSTDNVGIGTSSPNAKLEVNGQNSEAGFRAAWGSTYPNLYGEFKHAGSGGLQINANANGGWADMRLQTDGTTRVFIESAGKVGVATTSPNSQLHVNGSVSMAYRLVSGTYNVTASDCIIATGTSFSDVYVNLPSAVGITGRVYTIKQVYGGIDTWIYPYGTQKIDGQSGPYILGVAYQWVTLVSNGANWYIIGKNP